MPKLLQKYLDLTRINRPTGIWLLFLPCLFGVFLSLKKLPNPELGEIIRLVFLFFFGSVVMRSAGCVVNDLLDEKFDQKVARTKNRPLAAKKISRRQALILLASLLFFGLLILLQFNFPTILSGFAALILLVCYPLMKRITYYPQVFLGLTFNFGIIMASLALLEEIDDAAWLLYFCAIIWTVIYDTIYAFQDIEDDLQIGVKSTAIKFQKAPKAILLSLSFVMFFGLFLLGALENFRAGFFVIILACFWLTIRKIIECDLKNSSSCLALFKNNFWIGLLILIGIIAG